MTGPLQQLVPPGDENEGESALPPGYILHEFRIEKVLGVGGFGIVYLATDLQLERTVALKEYMPTSLALRQSGNIVAVRSERRRETFELGLRSFVNEARLLACFDNAALVKVYRFWEQNGTAYMVMPYYQGPTLKAWLQAQPDPPSEAWLKQLLIPLLDVLAMIHADHCYHRDIAPDNILLLGDTLQPVLLDFGAARRVIGDATQALTVILKPGYAPVEQYAAEVSMKQGPWTDVYALCAVLYRAIAGRPPTVSVGRMMKDDLVPLSVSAAGRYSAPFLAAIDAGLAVRPEQRPKDMAALRERLFAVPGDDSTVQHRHDQDPTVLLPQPGSELTIGPSPAPFVERRRATAVPVPLAPVPAPEDPAIRPPAVPTRRLLASPRTLLFGATGILLAAALATWLIPGANDKTVAAAPAAARRALAQRPPFSVLAGLDEIVAHSDGRIAVDSKASNERIVIGVDRMQFSVTSNQKGYLYVFLVGTDGAKLQLLFPNALDQHNQIASGVTVTLPSKGWSIMAAGPPGVNHIVTMVSRVPRDFRATGLGAPEAGQEFDLAQARLAWASADTGQAVFAGKADCGAAKSCDSAYGAQLIRIRELPAT